MLEKNGAAPLFDEKLYTLTIVNQVFFFLTEIIK